VAAMIDDLARRQISNWICLAALAAGFAWQIGQGGWMGAAYALAGSAAGFAVFLIFYLLGGMGGGDVKLMAGFGALLGASGVMWAALLIAAVGGIMAMGVIAWKQVWRMFGGTIEAKKGEKESIPYAPAIALGVWLSLVPRG
jgi:prepilin peptidase CpaA